MSALASLGQTVDAIQRALVENPAVAATAFAMGVGALALVPVTVALVRRWTPRVPVFFARWRFTQLGLVFAAGVLFSLASISGLQALAPDADHLLMGVFGTCLGLGATCALIAEIARRMDPDGMRSLGLWPGGSLRAAALGAVAYLLCLPALVALALLWPWLHAWSGGAPAQQPFFDLLARSEGWTLLLLVAVLVALQPLFEELIFRSFLQPLLVQNLGDRGGVVMTSLCFALLHGTAYFLPIFGLSLLLGALKLRTQRLTASWAVHALHNGLMLAAAAYGANGGGAT